MGKIRPDSAKVDGSSISEPLFARTESANREVSEGKADLWPRSFFFLRGPHGAANGQDSWGFFKDAQGFGRLDASSHAGFASSRPPPPWTSVIQFSLFLYDAWPWETWNCWSKLVGTCLSDLLRTHVVGRRQQSESIEAALDMEWRRFHELFCYWSVPSLVDSHNFLSRFGSLLVWVAGCHHDVTRWPCLVPLCDHVPDWQPRILLGMVEARLINVKNTTTTTTRR